ncbi:MAG: 4-hydroxybenzoate octaprenyltransferase [Gammaproteobacteria bacterium]|nr:4-hydroxybenzoate octaprenyltransferase [Gammaproteobacteria bacterium]
MSSWKQNPYIRLMRLDRPIGNFLLLWPTLWALWVAAGGPPKIDVLIVFVLGVLLMRAAGCVINDYADRDFDGQVERTKHRPLATGEVSAKQALALFAVLGLIAFALVLTQNWLTIQLSFVGMALAAIYPFTKRVTHLPQFVLGAAFGWATPMAFAAQTGELPPITWLMFGITLVWTVAYDTMYAMVDRADDLKAGIKSTAILFGRFDKLAIGLLQLATLVLLFLVGQIQDMNEWFFLSILLAALLAVYQQYLLKDRDRDLCFKAFLNNNHFGAVVFAGLVLGLL